MPDLIHVNYAQTGSSATTNPHGMRAMQAKAYQARDAQYLLLKAPPASGKSRALMFIALDKLAHQDVKKVIVAVPERSIGGSFGTTPLTKDGFFADWQPNDAYNLCTPGSDGSSSKVAAFKNFMNKPNEKILICTHATLRFAYEQLTNDAFNDCLVAIDEFHHVSANDDNILGGLLRGLMADSKAHIVAMTGSYFRGDSVAVLHPDDEAKFTKVTYNYYEQLNGYTHLKSLGIGYHFYQGKYLSALFDVLDTDKKTILHIPNVNSGESTKDKRTEVDTIIDTIGEIEKVDSKTGVIHVRRKTDGKLLKIADLVNDNPKDRDKISDYLRTLTSVDDMDLIIALGMAKEGFDWPYCEHALTVGYRGSLTEVIQIIGRCTRDSNNKIHAQFTNLIAQPDAQTDDVTFAVNNMLKAITASLLMEQVLAPTFKFRTKVSDNDPSVGTTISIGGFKAPSTQRVKAIVDADLNDLKANILQDNNMQRALSGGIDPEVMNKVLIPNIIKTKYPQLTDTELEEVRQYVVLDAVVKNNPIIDLKDLKKTIAQDDRVIKALAENVAQQDINQQIVPKIIKTLYPNISDADVQKFSDLAVKMGTKDAKSTTESDKRFIRMAGQFVNIDELHIDLIDQVNPFQKAYEVLSKSVTPKILRLIQDTIEATRIQVSEEEAVLMWPKIKAFKAAHGREPNLNTNDPMERRMAEVLIYIREQKRKMVNG